MRIAARLMFLSLALTLGACSLPDMDSFRAPDSATLFRPLSVTNVRDKVLPPVGADDLVDANGRCAGAFAAVGGDQSPGQDAALPMIPSVIALEMSECDVVKRAGSAENVDIGRGERGERAVTLTYIRGPQPGIYRFADGRLKSMERASEPPAPPKPARPAKAAPKSKQTVNR